MNNKEVEKECRIEAKKVGLTFKRGNGTINGSPSYKFTDRASGRVVLENCTLATSYNNVCSGFIGSYNKNRWEFEGI